MTALTFTVGLVCLSAGFSAVMTIAWFIWRSTRNSGWIDTTWTFGLGLVGFVGSVLPFAHSVNVRSWLVAGMAVIWSLRLGLHIAFRTRGITDDPRYAKLVHEWGADASRQMFWLLQKQALVSIPLALAMWVAAANPFPLPAAQALVAILIFGVAVIGEGVADQQLRWFRLKPDNKGRVCDSGLWRWSRHPNYFFEWLGWLSYPLLAIDFHGNYPWAVLAFAAPLCMYWLLVHVSGVPPLEAHMLAQRGEAFRRYQLKTNVFFPGPPRSQGTGTAGGG
jgi:steroid 5-alpha reductase family enzyme